LQPVRAFALSPEIYFRASHLSVVMYWKGRSFKLYSGILTSIVIVTIALLWAKPVVQNHDSNCDAEAFLTSPGKTVTVTAERVYVNPKTGRHQVFGVFIIPTNIKQWTPGLLSIDEVGIYCSRSTRYGPEYEGIVAPNKSIVMLDHIRTRTAIALFLQGKLNRLRDRTTWHYTYKLPESN
jgi:hypothetical protein